MACGLMFDLEKGWGNVMTCGFMFDMENVIV